MQVNVGDVLANKYRVERVLGAGGMGMVVAARHLDLDELVALKFMLTNDNPDITTRFLREARAAVRLKGEHVARVLDVGRLEGDAPYIVMEYLDGQDLSAVLKKGPLSIETAVEHVLQACTALAEAHSLGIVHRDLKPANLFLTRRPDGTSCIKILDFGISKVSGGIHDAAVTRTTDVMGSPLYMAPEQMTSSRDVDPRADIWALGVILFELVTNAVPFIGETLPQICMSIMSAKPLAISTKRTGLPSGFEAVVNRCLEKDKAARWQSVGELAQALVPFGGRRAADLAERTTFVLAASARASMASLSGAEPASVAALTTPSPALSDTGGDAPPARIETPQPAAAVKTNVSWATGGAEGRTKKGLVGAVIALGVFVLGGAAILIGRAASPTPDAGPAAATAPQNETVPAAETAVTASPATTPPPASVTAPPQVAPAPTSTASAAPAAATYVPPHPATAKPAAPGKPAPTATPKPAPPAKPGKPGADDDLYSNRK